MPMAPEGPAPPPGGEWQRLESGLADLFSTSLVVAMVSVFASTVATAGVAVFAQLDGDSLIDFFLLSIYVSTLVSIAVALLRKDPLLLLTPMVLSLLTCAIYYGFGPMLYQFGEREALDFNDAVFQVGHPELRATLLVNAIGTLCTFIGFFVMAGRTLGSIRKPVRIEPDNAMILFIAATVVLGLIGQIEVFVRTIYPSDEIDPMSSLTFARDSLWAGIGLMTLLAFRRGGKWIFFLVLLLVPVEAMVLLMFGKMMIMLPILAVGLGWFMHKPTIPRIGILAGVALILYLLITPYVTFGREMVGEVPGFEARTEAISIYVNSFASQLRENHNLDWWNIQVHDQSQDIKALPQQWWCRLNYANVQAFIMDRFDSGHPGNTFELAAIAWIPRFLWRDKPIIDSGLDLFNLVFHGGYGSNMGAGMFAEMYWDAGWPGVVLASTFMGLVYGFMTRIIYNGFRQNDWMMMPLMGLWATSGAKPDGWFHTQVVGSLALSMVYLYSLWGYRFVYSKSPGTFQSETHPVANPQASGIPSGAVDFPGLPPTSAGPDASTTFSPQPVRPA